LYRQQIDTQGSLLDVVLCCRYKKDMAKKRGRPPVGSGKAKAEYLEVRLEVAEKQAFQEAAGLAGLALSAWVRERLRKAARRELQDSGQPVPFLAGSGNRSSRPLRQNGADAPQ
jgi:hypothetical protein